MTSIMKHTLAITIEEFLNLPDNLSVMRKFLSDIHIDYSGIWFVLRGDSIYWEERDFSFVVVNSGDILISDIDFEKFKFTNKECNFHDVVRKHRVPIFDIVKAKVYSPDFPEKTRLAWGDMSNLFADIFGSDSCYWSDTDDGRRELLEKRFECHGIDTWMCTDTLVGTIAYFLNGVCIAVTFQSGRKSQIEVYWVNEQCYNFIRTAFEAIMLEKQRNFIVVGDVSLCPYDISDEKLVRDLYPFFKEDEKD